MTDRMSSFMTPQHVGQVLDLKPCIPGAPAEIHILEPNGMKLLVETTEFFPDVTPDHEKRPGRLLDKAGLIERTVQVAIPSIH